MQLLRSDKWSYAILLVVLLTIGALAVWHVINYTMEQIHPDQYQTVAIMIFGITAGFMMIAGAFGLWVINFMAQAETKRRVGLIVDAMDFLNDGITVIDSNGNIIGCNTAFRQLFNIQSVSGQQFKEVVPSLSEEEYDMLIKGQEAYEVVHELISDGIMRTLRFRSQHSRELTLIVVSDVTVLEARRAHSRQLAKLQLIAQLARGIANDFNSILTTISGHATVISRVSTLPADIKGAINTIASNADKGIILARHLIEFARPPQGASSTDKLIQHIVIAADTIKTAVPLPWQVEYEVKPDLPTVGINGVQIEQVLFNLGLLVVNFAKKHGIIKIFVGTPARNTIFDVPQKFACAIVIGATKEPSEIMQGHIINETLEGESGVILPVISSIIEHNGGKLESIQMPDGSMTFRIALPYAHKIEQVEVDFDMPGNLADYLADWSILVIAPHSRYMKLEKMLKFLKLRITHTDNVVSAMAKIETEQAYDAIIVDKELIDAEFSATLKVILKLAPHTALVVFTDSSDIQMDETIKENITVLKYDTTIYKLITAILEARSRVTKNKSGR